MHDFGKLLIKKMAHRMQTNKQKLQQQNEPFEQFFRQAIIVLFSR